MGMYDTINGEQVKCFPWVSWYNNGVSYHAGELECYGNGSRVPYKKPHYNYGKNFVILDLNRYPDRDYDYDYDYIMHVIVNGKVKDTFENKIGKIDWTTNGLVVAYTGELLNIKSSQDVKDYIKEQREYWDKFNEIRSKCNELFKEYIKHLHGIETLDKESEEYKFRNGKKDELHKLMDEEEERIKGKLQSLSDIHRTKWFVDTSNIDDLINLGEYIEAYNTCVRLKRDEDAERCREMIDRMLSGDVGIYDRYVAWQGDDEFIKGFKK